MSTIPVANSGCNAVPDWHYAFLAHILPAVQTLASFRFRNLLPVDREEAIAEAVAVAMIVFVRLVERGKDPQRFPGRLALYAVLRVKAGRIAGAQDRSGDVLSRMARQQRGFIVESLDVCSNPDGSSWQTVLVEDRKSTPADTAASRIDFAAWLGRMKSRRRQIAETLAAGFRTEEVAQLFNLSPGRISQMRREFEVSWHKFQNEAHQPVVEQYSAAA